MWQDKSKLNLLKYNVAVTQTASLLFPTTAAKHFIAPIILNLDIIDRNTRLARVGTGARYQLDHRAGVLDIFPVVW